MQTNEISRNNENNNQTSNNLMINSASQFLYNKNPSLIFNNNSYVVSIKSYLS